MTSDTSSLVRQLLCKNVTVCFLEKGLHFNEKLKFLNLFVYCNYYYVNASLSFYLYMYVIIIYPEMKRFMTPQGCEDFLKDSKKSPCAILRLF
jgi:hypothetical protein